MPRKLSIKGRRKQSTVGDTHAKPCCILSCERKGTRLLSSLRGNYSLKQSHSGRVCEGHYRRDLRKSKKGSNCNDDDHGCASPLKSKISPNCTKITIHKKKSMKKSLNVNTNLFDQDHNVASLMNDASFSSSLPNEMNSPITYDGSVFSPTSSMIPSPFETDSSQFDSFGTSNISQFSSSLPIDIDSLLSSTKTKSTHENTSSKSDLFTNLLRGNDSPIDSDMFGQSSMFPNMNTTNESSMNSMSKSLSNNSIVDVLNNNGNKSNIPLSPISTSFQPGLLTNQRNFMLNKKVIISSAKTDMDLHNSGNPLIKATRERAISMIASTQNPGQLYNFSTSAPLFGNAKNATSEKSYPPSEVVLSSPLSARLSKSPFGQKKEFSILDSLNTRTINFSTFNVKNAKSSSQPISIVSQRQRSNSLFDNYSNHSYNKLNHVQQAKLLQNSLTFVEKNLDNVLEENGLITSSHNWGSKPTHEDVFPLELNENFEFESNMDNEKPDSDESSNTEEENIFDDDQFAEKTATNGTYLFNDFAPNSSDEVNSEKPTTTIESIFNGFKMTSGNTLDQPQIMEDAQHNGLVDVDWWN